VYGYSTGYVSLVRCVKRGHPVLFPDVSPTRVRLQELREKAELSKAALAELSGVRRATIIEIENGTATRVSLKVLDKLASALGVQPGELLEQTGKRK
jgi:DNA-binding Xre family transcriptional regulator